MLEALAAGVPVVCLDHQGVHDVVTDDCGVKIPVTTPREVIAGLSDSHRATRRRPGRAGAAQPGAVERAASTSGRGKSRAMAELYREVLGGRWSDQLAIAERRSAARGL